MSDKNIDIMEMKKRIVRSIAQAERKNSREVIKNSDDEMAKVVKRIIEREYRVYANKKNISE